MTRPISDTASDLALGAAIVLGFTTAVGGLYPDGRALVLGLVIVAALFGGGALRPALFGPALAAGVALFFAPIPGLGWETVFQLIFFAVAGSVLGGHLDRGGVAGALMLAGVALSLSIISEAGAHVALLGRNGLGLGAAGFLVGANVSSVALAAVLPACVAVIARGGRSRSVGIAAAVVVSTAIVLTGSRTGLIAAVAGLAPFWLDLSPRHRRILGVSIIVLLLAGVFLYLPRFIAKLDPSFITNAQRVSMIRGVTAAAIESPWAGHGPGAFPILGQAYLSWPKWELHPHSLFLRVLFECGLIGIAGWTWMLVSAAGGAAGRGASKEGERRLSCAVLLALVAGSITDDVLWIPALGGLFFLAAAGSVPVHGGLIESIGESRCVLARIATRGMIVLAGFAAAFLPLVGEAWRGLPFESNLDAMDRAVASNAEPEFMGWQSDPMALRIGAYARWTRGDRAGALVLVNRALALDPKMILGPHHLDLAWMEEERGETEAARRSIAIARRLAPVLTARYCGATRGVETTAVTRSWLDRHYGIEFPDASIITAEMMETVADPLDWRHYRNEAMVAWERGDTPRALVALERARSLAASQYGRDPVLLRLEANLVRERDSANLVPSPASEMPASEPLKKGRAASPAVGRSTLLEAARARSAPAFPYRVFAPLIYRRMPSTSGENSPWWTPRMSGDAPVACP